ncbi:hypothetical protein BDB01DRAFT_718224 [Pilobolus umbonatus]|nr:hypothetical protein BDB01DRAFT_718224 [Pilobolus umbonatus]
MPPLKGRQIIAPLYDVDEETVLTDFKNLVEVLRMRSSRTMEKTQEAFVMVDSKGKEQASLTWEKTYTKAEKIARNIVDNINPGDKVALIYHKSDTLEFISALLGCFLAGVIAVPVNSTDEVSEVLFILTITQCTLILTTDQNYRVLMKEMQSKSTEFPKDTKWVKTNEMSIWNMSKKALDYRSIKALSFAYIEYTKANNGELKGVIITHESIMKQCAAFQASTSLPDNEKQLKSRNGKQPSQTIVSHLEPRQQIGLILTVFHSIYAGNKVIFTTESIADTPSVWIYLLSRYKATMALTTYPALKCISDYFQSHSKEVRSYSKKTPPDLSSLQHLLIDANVTNVRLNEYIAEWLLRPLGVAGNPLEVIYPILSLSEYGGMIISMRDSVNHDGMESGQLLTSVENSGRESYYSHTSKSTIYATNSNRNYMCIFDSDALKLGKAVVLNISSHEGTLNDVNDNKRTRIQSFGFAMPEVNIAIVDPDTDVLCPRNTLGEIWVNSTSLGNGFWGLPKHTESIFQARPIFIPSDSCYPEHHQEMYLRTGLNGTMVGGRLFVLGAFEDRIRQQRLGDDFGIEETYYSHELVQTLNEVLNINRCAIFEIYVKEQHLPIVICELAANKSELHGISKQINDVLTDIHGLRPFAVMFVGPDKLPSQVIHGRNVIHPLQTKQFFLQGLLPIRHIRLDVDRTIFHLAKHEDITRSIWLSNLAYDSAVRMGAITPNTQQQHTGIEVVTTVRDDYTGQDLFRFTNIIDILQWRTSILPDEIAYTTSPISCKASDSKSYSWQKLNHKSVAMALHLSKKGPRLGNRVIVLVSFGMEYIVSIYACLYMGLVPVPIDPIDPQTQSRQIQDFVQKLKGTIHQLKIAYIITNSNSEDMLKNSNVKNAIKQQHLKLPNCINISKMSKQHKILGKGSGPLMYPDWATAKKNNPAVILVQNSSDSIERYAYFGHDTIINHCRTEKATCQMKRGKGIIITGLGTYDGLGFLHALFMGVYIGSTTTIIPLFDYYANPAVFFECLQKYKAKDVCATNALIQFAMNRMDTDSSRHIILRCVQNMMIANDNRPSPLLYQHVTRHFGKYRLDSESINTVYSHAGNPMITTRSYMLSKPITLVLDPYWLRQGIVRVLKHKDEQSGIALNDSGIVTSNTMIAIVNPETQKLSPVNKIGEIWVSSDGNIKTFHGMTYHEQASQFGAVIVGGNPQVKYMRTGDLGFLWNVRRHSNSKSEEGQCLYVLGPMSETIMKDGLIHFATDIEQHIEQCHAAIPSRGSIVFQTHKEIVAVVSIESNLFALSIVPLIVKCILEYHMFLIDTIVIVHPNNFPRSRFGDKERGRAMNMFIEENL